MSSNTSVSYIDAQLGLFVRAGAALAALLPVAGLVIHLGGFGGALNSGSFGYSIYMDVLGLSMLGAASFVAGAYLVLGAVVIGITHRPMSRLMDLIARWRTFRGRRMKGVRLLVESIPHAVWTVIMWFAFAGAWFSLWIITISILVTLVGRSRRRQQMWSYAVALAVLVFVFLVEFGSQQGLRLGNPAVYWADSGYLGIYCPVGSVNGLTYLQDCAQVNQVDFFAIQTSSITKIEPLYGFR